jgi:hypothetical protein
MLGAGIPGCAGCGLWVAMWGSSFSPKWHKISPGRVSVLSCHRLKFVSDCLFYCVLILYCLYH